MKASLSVFSIMVLSLVSLSCRTDQQEEASPSARIMHYADFAPSQSSQKEEDAHPSPDHNPLRMVIMTADLQIEVSKCDDALAQVQAIANQNGGFVVQSTARANGGRNVSGETMLRVPSKSFQEALKGIRKLANNVESQTIRGNDVTEEFYDINARLENKQKAEGRYRELLKSAKNVKDILEVEQALTDIREQIDKLSGRKKYLSDQIDLSTISVRLHEPGFMEAQQLGLWTKIKNGFNRGLTGFGDVVGTTITVLIALGPLLVILFMALVLGLRIWRRRKNTIGIKST